MGKKLDLTGQKYGRLTVIAPAPNKGRRTQWLCRCDCGNEKICETDALRSGKTKSCGCLHKEQLIERNKAGVRDLTGQRFGKLTVIKRDGTKYNHAAWLCKCDCGNFKTVGMHELLYNETLSCGCLRSSFGELSIYNILKNNNISFQKEYIFSDLLSENGVPLRFDFAIFDNNNQLQRLIEYDGEQHYSKKTEGIWTDTLEQRQERDKIKNEYCKKHNIPLVRIPYTEKNSITLEKLLGNQFLIE